ncbi:ABC transporter substrate-binding protein [Bifidobacterium scardovii]|uniref:ABC-type sugar transport periplasmic binding protein n=1 Tax=Bifidobacterium scardovii TaxID=158787 RepID=A0A087D3J6_9BIFI|nr:ABC transporter substrate-binding protein [Bifidobacterium scardovii]KFI90096.1 ABC-type sugar transport periplasmic binding protein [Bifidobacterium scardovii]MDK6349208.1 ABC transporter substrate-binding protein [Bifidobacterium scardovii]MDU8980751.1 ABC transporter substrate-binding protein [Bifidobacterium scardovii]
MTGRQSRFIQVASLALAGSLLFAGCGSSPANQSTGSGGKQIVTMWGSWSGDQVDQINQMTAAFNKSQSKYEVSYVAQEQVEQKLLTAIASGQVPDLVMWDRYQTALYAPKGAVQAIDEFVKKDAIDLDAFYPQAIAEMESGGKLYGLPLLVDVRSLAYNADLFNQAGATPPTTWDELLEVAKKLTIKDDSGKLSRAGFLLNDPGLFNMWLWQAGGELLSADGKKTAYNSSSGLEVLNFWKSMLDAGVYVNGFADTNDVFAAGDAAMKLTGPWDIPTLDKAEGLNYAIAEPPAGPGGDKSSIMGGFGLVIPTGAKQSEGAWEFMKWWSTSVENGVKFAKISGWFPANREASNNEYFTKNDKYAAFVKTLDYARTRPLVSGYSDVEGKALTPALQKFMSNELTAGEAFKEAQTQGDQLLAKAGA